MEIAKAVVLAVDCRGKEPWPSLGRPGRARHDPANAGEELVGRERADDVVVSADEQLADAVPGLGPVAETKTRSSHPVEGSG
jgi:hypothetical protein